MLILSNSEIFAHSSFRFLHPPSHLVPAHNCSHNSCSGETVTNVTPKIVSGLVVKTPITESVPSTGKSIWAPFDLPIQFLCIVLTFSGNEILSSSSRSSSEYSVILRNHCAISFCTTSRPHLQQRLFFTCSLASTVSQSTHQFTGAILLSTRPLSFRVRNMS